MEKQNNLKESGFAHIAVVLAFVIAAIVFGGWLVWQRNKDSESANNSNSAKPSHSNESESKPEGDKQIAPDGWLYYKNDEAGFSFYYPPEWGEVYKAGEEAGSVGGGKFYKFTAAEALSFEAHSRNREVSSLEFGNIEPAVVDVYLQDDTPIVQLASGLKSFRDFTNDQVVKKLNGDKICLAEDYDAGNYVEGANSAFSYTYFVYCGLINGDFGAFTISSGQGDKSKPETQKLKEDITKLIQTFEII